jgi:hypothetical protein
LAGHPILLRNRLPAVFHGGMPNSLSARDARILLWLVAAAICWRWLLGIRVPLPGIEDCYDLHAAEQVAIGDGGALLALWWRPLWALLLAPAVWLGAEVFAAAQVLACVCGGLAVWPVALAAERIRAGAGIPAAVLLLAASLPAHAAGLGSAVAIGNLLVASMLLALAHGRLALALAFCLLVGAMGTRQLAPAGELPDGVMRSGPSGWWAALQIGWSVLLPFACLSLLPDPRRNRSLVPCWILFALVLVVGLVIGNGLVSLPLWAPLPALLSAVAVARLPYRLRDVLLALLVAFEFQVAWGHAEPRERIVQRLLGQQLRGSLPPGQRLVGDLPRLLLFAGQLPRPIRDSEELLQVMASDTVGALVVADRRLLSPTLTATLASRYLRHQVAGSLRDLVADAELQVFLRR